MDIQQNYFQLFALEPAFVLPTADIASRYRELQRQTHPDRFASQGEQQQRLAVQFTAFINEAYETLLEPVKRAYYLLKLAGIEVPTHQTMQSDHQFLMRQMMLREQLEEAQHSANPEAALESVTVELERDLEQNEQLFSDYYQSQDYAKAADQAAKMQFLYKLHHEVEQLEERLLGY